MPDQAAARHRLRVVPITLAQAKEFITEHHRHNVPPVGWKFGVGLSDGEQLVGVAVGSRPVARALDDGVTLEVTRTCTDGSRNANSMLYGAVRRIAKAMGYHRIITYTLASEPGSSLKASGFEVDEELAPRKGWDTPSRRRDNERTPTEVGKTRWVCWLVEPQEGAA